jgi:hypothetical protein
MGVNNDVVVVLGVEYDYTELKNFIGHCETIELAKDIGTNYLTNLWSESGYPYSSPYYDANEEDCSYLLGIELKNDIEPDMMYKILQQKDDVKLLIRNFSEKYNVVNKENEVKFMFRSHVW